MHVLVDMDGVLTNFEGEFLNRWRIRHPDAPFIELEDRRTFYVSDQLGLQWRPQCRAITRERGFFAEMQPIEGAFEALEEMREAGHDIWICTAPIIDSQFCIAEKHDWLVRHLGVDILNQVVIAHDKTLVRGDILIDDRPEVTGLLTPVWEHMLFDAPYNREVTDKRRVDWNSWRTVLHS